MKSTTTGVPVKLWAMGTGLAVTMLLSMALAALGAALMETGALPPQHMTILVCGITVLATFLGALVCGKKADGTRLPLCLSACAVYLLLIFVLRRLIFGSMGTALWRIPVCALVGSVMGAILSSRAKRRR